MIKALAIVSALGVAGALASAAAAAPSVTPQGSAVLNYEIQDSLGEIQSCQMAQQRSSSADLKEFCTKMIGQHEQIVHDAQQLASRLGVTVMNMPAPDSVIDKAALMKEPASEFDNAFMRDQIEDHEHDISTTRDAVESVENPQIKAFAQKTLAILDMHLYLSIQTRDKLAK